MTRNDNIKGITVFNVHNKQSLFADDASFFLDGSRNSFKSLIDTIERFGLISGLKINESKCIVLKLGSCRKKKKLNYIKAKKNLWTSDCASTLGITFSNNKTMIDINLAPKISEFQRCLNCWKKWHLSLIGKITVIKTFAWP